MKYAYKFELHETHENVFFQYYMYTVKCTEYTVENTKSLIDLEYDRKKLAYKLYLSNS